MKQKKISCAGAIFIDENKRILLEDRRRIKKHGEHWSFFGGRMESGETEEQTLRREIFEELNYNITNYKFFRKYSFSPAEGLYFTYYMYIAKCPDLTKIKVHSKAAAKLFTLKQSLRLRMLFIDKIIIRDAAAEIKKNSNML